MAKNNDGNNKGNSGSSNEFTADEQNQRRRASKAAQRRTAHARAVSGKSVGTGNPGDYLFAYIADDKRSVFLKSKRDERLMHGTHALLAIMGIRASLGIHNPGSSTFIKGQQAADVATQLVKMYQETDPEFMYPTGLSLKMGSLGLACNAVRAGMAHVEHHVLEGGIREGREAIVLAMKAGRQRVLASV